MGRVLVGKFTATWAYMAGQAGAEHPSITASSLWQPTPIEQGRQRPVTVNGNTDPSKTMSSPWGTAPTTLASSAPADLDHAQIIQPQAASDGHIRSHDHAQIIQSAVHAHHTQQLQQEKSKWVETHLVQAAPNSSTTHLIRDQEQNAHSANTPSRQQPSTSGHQPRSSSIAPSRNCPSDPSSRTARSPAARNNRAYPKSNLGRSIQAMAINQRTVIRQHLQPPQIATDGPRVLKRQTPLRSLISNCLSRLRDQSLCHILNRASHRQLNTEALPSLVHHCRLSDHLASIRSIMFSSKPATQFSAWIYRASARYAHRPISWSYSKKTRSPSAMLLTNA
ncbi:hypothetical protein ACLOJK_012770 [Asimina triloba]